MKALVAKRPSRPPATTGRTRFAASPWAGVGNEPAELDFIAEDLIHDTFDRRRGSRGYRQQD